MRTTRAAQVTHRDTQKVWLIRQRSSPARSRCERCDDNVQMLTTEEAAAFAHADAATINSLVKLSKLHATEGAEGSPFICLNSLLSEQAANKK